MSKAFMGFIKGAGMGMMIGCVTGAVSSCYMRRNKRGLKRNVGKALRNVGDLVDDVTDMF